MAYTTINKSKDHFDGKIYLGSSSAVTVTGLEFQPDWVWVKDRDNGNNHVLVDAVRGAGKFLQSNLTNAEVNNSSQSISAFTSDGFTTGTANPANESASTTKGFMSWNWKAGGSGSANTDGSINTTVSANTTAGFSIVTYTGNGQSGNNTFGHGLGTAPQLIMWMPRSGTTNKHFWSHALPLSGGEYQAMQLNLQNAASAFGSSSVMNGQAPTSTVFTLENADYNNSGSTYVAYCFVEKTGYSKFGSYTGNGNADGVFVYTGFKPAFLLIKKYTDTSHWQMVDNKRPGYNPNSNYLRANKSDAEATDIPFDILSNGFKARSTDGSYNASSQSYIYMAFAEAPLVGTNNVPCTAR